MHPANPSSAPGCVGNAFYPAHAALGLGPPSNRTGGTRMYPITYEADYLRERNRLTTFFRLILAIPWIIVAYVYEIAVFAVAVIAWFALVILGRYPQWAYDFNAGALRFFVRAFAWMFLQTDQF